MVIGDLLRLWDKRESVHILSHYLMQTRGYVYAHADEPVVRKVEELFRRAITLRKEGYPLQYILGTWDFYTIELRVQEGVLIPRKETELLVDTALRYAHEQGWIAPTVLDVGFGTGAIALAMQKHLPAAHVTGTDISRCALQIAKENARDLGLERVRFLEGDLFSSVEGEGFDIILSNPPYLSQKDRERMQKELSFEPEMALFAGPEGLDIYRRLIPQAYGHLHDTGLLLLEIGETQAEEVCRLLREAGFSCVCVQKDLAGHDRMITAKKGGEPC